MHIVVIVLGDLGRSPRMQYHANSISAMNEVDKITLIGYEGEKCIDSVVSNPKIVQRRFAIPLFTAIKRISIIHTVLRGIAMIAIVLKNLASIGSYDVILIQNPPCLPAAICAWIMSQWNGSRIIIDWHNLGFKMFEERHGPKHILVRFSKYLEHALAFIAHSHISVSVAMSKWLQTEFDITAAVVHDKPASIFSRQRPPINIVHQLYLKLGFIDDKLFSFCSTSSTAETTGSRTIQTIQYDGTLRWRGDDFCPLIISSTSWTPDEDFGLFLNALLLLNNKLAEINANLGILPDENSSHTLRKLPLRVLVAITGKGPQRAEYEAKIRQLELENKMQFVRVRTVWLEPNEYPILMGCANLGVCLHTSTSGLDLPMKVLDMFGSGVAVCAAQFPALSELVQDNINGRVFSNEIQLSEQMLSLLFSGKLPHETDDFTPRTANTKRNWTWEATSLIRLRCNAATIGSWNDNWDQTMKPVIHKAIQCRRYPANIIVFVVIIVVICTIVLHFGTNWLRLN